MKTASLQSGSNGNCIYVEADDVRLLFDAGISGVRAQQRLGRLGSDICGVDALLISHDHADHSRCMGIYQRKFGLPVHVTEKTLDSAARRNSLGKIKRVEHFTAGSVLRFDRVTVETIPTPHDGVDGVGFVVDDGHCRLGILTDLGHVFSGLDEVIGSLDAVYLESNYDREMLAVGDYPEFLKARIQGPGGHLSNVEAAELLSGKGRLRWACLAHLSEENNDPQTALRTHRRVLGEQLPLQLASRHKASGLLQV